MQFVTVVDVWQALSPTEAVTLIEEHVRHLEEQMSSTRSTIERGLQLRVDRLFLVEDRYALTLLEARLTFATGIKILP